MASQDANKNVKPGDKFFNITNINNSTSTIPSTNSNTSVSTSGNTNKDTRLSWVNSNTPGFKLISSSEFR